MKTKTKKTWGATRKTSNALAEGSGAVSDVNDELKGIKLRQHQWPLDYATHAKSRSDESKMATGTRDHELVLAPLQPELHIGFPAPSRQPVVEETSNAEVTAIRASPSKNADTEPSPFLERIEHDSDNENHERPRTPPSERARFARERQDARAEQLRQIEEDKAVVDNGAERGAMGLPYEEVEGMLGLSGKGGPLLLTNYAHFQEKEEIVTPGPAAEESAAHNGRRPARRSVWRETKPAKIATADVMSGSWATPWKARLPITSSLDAAVTVILETLLGFLDEGTLCSTGFPPLAWGTFTGVPQTGCCRGKQRAQRTDRTHAAVHMHENSEHDEKQNVELMRLDAWLSYVGRVPEIVEDPHDLLSQTPAFVHFLMDEFELDFQDIDLSARKGELQDIQGLAANVMDLLTDEELTQPEQLYVLVALP
ncbi:hypothetical protein F5Y19DRAFT_488021 [Xylariaceae sp. FL1651]|nr:hypothetical protein F5Y19DRAFT_488021 [Xylariaceae sp. FL1651]